jgi:hypothetical protein
MSTIRMDVWRPMSHLRALHYVGDAAFDKDSLHEHIYTWAPDDDIWGGISDEAVRADLRIQLTSTFAPHEPLDKRRVDKLHAVVKHLSEIARDPGSNQWMSSSSTTSGGGVDSIALRLAPTLALLHRVRWIVETFKDVPDATITVR